MEQLNKQIEEQDRLTKVYKDQVAAKYRFSFLGPLPRRFLLSMSAAHLATRRDKENLEALQKKLSDWLLTECECVKDDRDEQGLEPATSCVSCTPMLTALAALR